jgi:PAS domain S-box-containing protein
LQATPEVQVLVVDDDPFIRDFLPPLLQRGNAGPMSVEAVATPAEALDWVRRQPPGRLVVLSDHNLQASLTGLQLLDQVRAERPDAVRILFSGHTRSEVRGIEQADLHGFLEKPFRLAALVKPFHDLVTVAFDGRQAPVPTASPGPGDLGDPEVLHAFVRAGLKGEEGRAKRLLGEAVRRGGGERVQQLALTALGWQNRLLEMVARHEPLQLVWNNLARAVEDQFPDANVALLLLRDDRFHVIAAPSMDRAQVALLDGMPNDPAQGPCSTAVQQRRRVIVPDVQADPRWPALRGSAATGRWWSFPILANDGTPRGTFAVHGGRPAEPDDHDVQLLELATGLARLALDTAEGTAALRGAEARMSSIVASALDAIVSIDHHGLVVEWNPSAERIFGHSRAAAMGRPMADLIVPPHLRAAHHEGLRRHLATGETRVMGRKIEIEALRADGTTFPVELAIVRLATEGPPTFTAFIRDLTERTRQTAELHDRTERLRAIFEQVAVGVAQFGLDGRFLLVNDRYCQIVGRGRDELLRQAFHDVTGAAHRAKDIALFEGVVRGGAPALTDSRLQRPDGSEVWVRRSLSLVRDAQGRPTVVVGVVQEITQQKAAEEALQHLNGTLEWRVQQRTRALQEANRDLESFSYVLSHDLQAPLRTLDYLLGTGLKHAQDPVLQETLQRGREAVHRMASLTQGMLALARVSQGPLAFEPVDLSAIAAQIVADRRAAEPSRSVDVDIEDGIVVQGDPRLLWSVLDNLVGNAWKYTWQRSPARIEVGTAQRDGRPAVYVRDNGVGFDAGTATALFEPFTRLSPNEGPEGLGIGLATVRRIVERHGGRVWAESSPGEGATFWFTVAETAPS